MINIALHNHSDFSIDKNSINDLTNLVLNNHGYTNGEINIIITDDDSLRKMKIQFFNEDVFTDVIAFNIEESPFEGEIYISYHRVIDNAQKFNQPIEVELKRVVVHGLLHLCGHEDSTPKLKNNMSSLEDNFLKQFNQLVIIDNA
tara:strand:+ start:794 stop:1228 length:435 start_codon:yes stop_codon:yes gene_type:complete